MSMVAHEMVEIRVSLTPKRDDDFVPRDSAHAIVWVTTLEASDMRALEYVTRRLVDDLMREWVGANK